MKQLDGGLLLQVAFIPFKSYALCDRERVEDRNTKIRGKILVSRDAVLVGCNTHVKGSLQ